VTSIKFVMLLFAFPASIRTLQWKVKMTKQARLSLKLLTGVHKDEINKK
jgi:hypothetical protein